MNTNFAFRLQMNMINFFHVFSRPLSQPRVLDFLSNVYSNRFRSLLQSPNRCLPRDEVECPWSKKDNQQSTKTNKNQLKVLSTEALEKLPQKQSPTTLRIADRTTSTTTLKHEETTTNQPNPVTSAIPKSSTYSYFSFLSLLP